MKLDSSLDSGLFLRQTLSCLVEIQSISCSQMLDWVDCSEVERSPDKVGNAWVFRGTRVPVRALFENLESGATIDEFVEWFPGVTRAQAQTVLEHAEESLAKV